MLPLKWFSLFIKKETQTFVTKQLILMKLHTYIFAGCLFFLANTVNAQTTSLPNSIDASIHDLQTFVANKEYVSSYQLAKELKHNTVYTNSATIKERIDYYFLVSGLQLNEKGIAEQASEFIKAALDPALRQMMSFYVGTY
jgi:hypothetical protein